MLALYKYYIKKNLVEQLEKCCRSYALDTVLENR